jgi:hypothetical protein
MENLIKLVIIGVIIAIVLLAGPWCLIWAVNTLVAAGGVANFYIPFTFWTWLSAIVLGGFAVLPGSRRS